MPLCICNFCGLGFSVMDSENFWDSEKNIILYLCNKHLLERLPHHVHIPWLDCEIKKCSVCEKTGGGCNGMKDCPVFNVYGT